jgi:hypothetical protein
MFKSDGRHRAQRGPQPEAFQQPFSNINCRSSLRKESLPVDITIPDQTYTAYKSLRLSNSRWWNATNSANNLKGSDQPSPLIEPALLPKPCNLIFGGFLHRPQLQAKVFVARRCLKVHVAPS